MDIVIFDDDTNDRVALERMTAKLPNVELVFSTGEMEALSKFIANRNQPAVYLLDVWVGGDSIGFLISDKIWKKNDGSKIVFVSDYPSTWFASIHEQFKSVVCIEKGGKTMDKLTQLFKELQDAEPRRGYFVIGNNFESYQFPHEQILYLQTVKSKRYIEVVSENGRVGPIPNFNRTFAELVPVLNENILDDPKFVQINPGVIVNKDHCVRWCKKRKGGTVEIENGEIFSWTSKFRREITDDNN